MAPFASPEQFAAWYQIPQEELSAATVELLLDSASGLIRAELRQQVAPRVDDDEATFDADDLDGRIIALPELPVWEVSSVVEAGAELDPGDYHADLGADGRRGLLRRHGRPWRGPVEVVYSHGYRLPSDGTAEALPTTLRTITLRMVARAYGNPDELRQSSTGGSSSTYAAERPGLYLTAGDLDTLAPYYRGHGAGSR